MARKIRIASISMAYGERPPAADRQDNLSYVSQTVQDASVFKPDLIAVPEAFSYAGLGGDPAFGEEDKQFLAELARRHQTNIVGGVYEERNGQIHNTAIVFDRSGQCAGRYDKIHPVIYELKQGIAAGDINQPPVQLDFGKLGLRTCFDANWPQDWTRLADDGADLIAFISQMPGGTLLNMLAMLTHLPIVATSFRPRGGVIDHMGRWISEINRASVWTWTTIDLECVLFHMDNQYKKTKNIRRKYGESVRIEVFPDEALFSIEPMDELLSIKTIMQEFGLITYREYVQNSDAERAASI